MSTINIVRNNKYNKKDLILIWKQLENIQLKPLQKTL